MIPPSQSALRRFVIDGLRQTLDSYTTHTLALHRFAWELHTRIATLAELTALPQWRLLATLRAAHHTIAELDAALRAPGRDELTPAEARALATAVATLRVTLTQLAPVSSGEPRPALTVLPGHLHRRRRAAGHGRAGGHAHPAAHDQHAGRDQPTGHGQHGGHEQPARHEPAAHGRPADHGGRAGQRRHTGRGQPARHGTPGGRGKPTGASATATDSGVPAAAPPPDTGRLTG